MKTLLETAIADGRFTQFVTALKAGSFADTLRLPGPFTLFAPTDEAFAKMTPNAIAALLRDTRRLKSLLTYHVLSGAKATKDLESGPLRTVEGRSLRIVVEKSAIQVSGATIVTRDIPATNGLLHAIDTVLTPPLQTVEAA